MNNITKRYGKNIVLDSVSINFVGATLIIGENGSGKTTLLKIIAGLIKKYDGNIDYKDNVSILLDQSALFDLKSGEENLLYYLNKDEYNKALKYIEAFNMLDYYKNMVRTYSNGMKKKLSIVMALSKDKDVYILDEPTNSLDIESIKILKDLLKEIKKDKTIIISSHDISIFDIDLIDSIYLLKNHDIISKSIEDFDYTIYKVKTLNGIKDNEYEYVMKDDCLYFKVPNNKIKDFSLYLSQFVILEMTPLNYLDSIYLEGLYEKNA